MRRSKKSKSKQEAQGKETCYFCGRGILEDKRVTVDFRWGDQLVIIKDIPAQVCNECGERYYSLEVSKEMDRIVQQGRTDHKVEVPVVTMSK